MFRKKQTPASPPSRTVRGQQSAPVFSYYSSRANADSADPRRSDAAKPSAPKRARRITARKLVSYAPSLAAGVALLACLVYVSTLGSNPKVQILGEQSKTGIIAGKESYEQEVKGIFESSLTNRSKLLIDTDKIAQQIEDRFPELGEVSVILPLVGRRPIVSVRPADPALLLGTLDGGFVIDENGRVVAEASEVESSVRDKLPTVQDESGFGVERGKYAMPSETVTFLSQVATYLKNGKVPVESFVLPTVANELHVKIKDKPYYAKFNTRGDSRVQSGTLIATKKKLDKDGVTPKVYIDVRVPGKAYYK